MSDVGTEIFQLVTLGMYNDPLAMYREYIQNSADAFALEGRASGTVKITINRGDSSIVICDDGPGLSPKRARRALLPIARSEKAKQRLRGFRGIGRLSGLAFADSVAFLTRSKPDEPITRVFWDGAKINSLRRESNISWEDIRNCVSVDTITDLKRPDHFFEVQVHGIARHAAGVVLNEQLVRSYIGEVCPVPMPRDFSFANAIKKRFADDYQPLALSVELDGDPNPITRPYADSIAFAPGKSGPFTEFQPVDVPSLSGGNIAAVGWILHSSYLGAIPRGPGIRGIRVRLGNIQVGDESALDHLFPEERFNRWCVGEIHVLDPELVPNARRDYFEPGPSLRNFENHMAAICRTVADRCRGASKSRNRMGKLQSLLRDVDDARALAGSGYLSNQTAANLLEETISRVRQVRTTYMKSNSLAISEQALLDDAEKSLAPCPSEHNGATDIRTGDEAIYQRVFGALTTLARSPGEAKQVIEAVMKEVSHGGR
ncbi:ATP-binding protein [Candidatus Foliamicus sp.]